MVKSQNIHRYKRISLLDTKKFNNYDRQFANKINELIIEYHHIAKDFEIYKKAYKELVLGKKINITYI